MLWPKINCNLENYFMENGLKSDFLNISNIVPMLRKFPQQLCKYLNTNVSYEYNVMTITIFIFSHFGWPNHTAIECSVTYELSQDGLPLS